MPAPAAMAIWPKALQAFMYSPKASSAKAQLDMGACIFYVAMHCQGILQETQLQMGACIFYLAMHYQGIVQDAHPETPFRGGHLMTCRAPVAMQNA